MAKSKEKKIEKVEKTERDVKSLSVGKNENFSKWYTDIVKKAELADLRSGVKGFLVFQPWSVLAMEKMFSYFERSLQKKGHKPYYFPTLVPENNLKKEKDHVKGFVPEVFWVTEAGDKKLDERFALRPTSETLFYQMFGIWIRSYKDLPFKAYQRANVFRYETKATRPFLRSREFHWIEAHCAHESLEDAEKQVREDMETTKEVMHDLFGLPFLFFERPQWDKFPGADRTFAADVLNPDGRVIQQPSTHFISQNFSKAFDIKFKDKNDKEKLAYITCYGPSISRIFASVVIVHGDDKGLRFPWDIAPLKVMIVPISNNPKVKKKADEIKKKVEKIASVDIDNNENKTPGEKFNYWEMKGVPIRIDLGEMEIEKGKLTVFRRDLNKKEIIDEGEIINYVSKVSRECTKNLIKEADKIFEGKIKNVKSIKEMKKVIDEGGIARCGFCSVDKDGEKCAEIVEKEVGAKVRGVNLEKESIIDDCVICGKKAGHVVYIAKDY
jgi:prolyl-tRNA synthetase